MNETNENKENAIKLNLLIEALGESKTLQELTKALDPNELSENLDYIIKMYDIDINY